MLESKLSRVSAAVVVAFVIFVCYIFSNTFGVTSCDPDVLCRRSLHFGLKPANVSVPSNHSYTSPTKEITVKPPVPVRVHRRFAVDTGTEYIELDHGMPPSEAIQNSLQPGAFTSRECHAYSIATGVCLDDSLRCRQSCYFSNICYDSHKSQFLYFSSNNETSRMDPPPQYGNNEHEMQVDYIEGRSIDQYISEQKYERVKWQTNRTIVFREMYADENYYHLMHDSFGGLFWMAWDFNELKDLHIVLVEPADARYPHSQFFADKGISTLEELRSSADLTCFTRAMVGPGHRATWWSSTGFEYATGYVDFLGTIDPPGQNKMPEPNREERINPVSFFMRDTYLRGLGIDPASSGHQQIPHIVIIQRTHSRVILNHGEMLDYLKLAFESSKRAVIMSVHGEDLSQHDTAALFANASVLIGMHGAGLSNMQYLPPRAQVIEIMGNGFVNPSLSVLAHSLGLRHTPLYTDRNGGCPYPSYDPHCREADAHVPLKELTMHLDWILRDLRADRVSEKLWRRNPSS